MNDGYFSRFVWVFFYQNFALYDIRWNSRYKMIIDDHYSHLQWATVQWKQLMHAFHECLLVYMHICMWMTTLLVLEHITNCVLHITGTKTIEFSIILLRYTFTPLVSIVLLYNVNIVCACPLMMESFCYSEISSAVTQSPDHVYYLIDFALIALLSSTCHYSNLWMFFVLIWLFIKLII